jgi:hypothetical protein
LANWEAAQLGNSIGIATFNKFYVVLQSEKHLTCIEKYGLSGGEKA